MGEGEQDLQAYRSTTGLCCKAEEALFSFLDYLDIGAGAIGSALLKRSYKPFWVGIILSAIIFGLLHASYDSTFAVEVIAAMFFGFMAGYVFSKSDSLYPSMLTHILVNSIGVLAILSITLIH